MKDTSLMMTLTLVAALAGFGGGYVTRGALNGSANLGPTATEGQIEAARQQGYAQAQKDINDIFVQKNLSYPIGQEITTVYGFVRDVGTDTFTVEYDEAQFSVLKSGLVRKTVRLSSEGVINEIVDAPTSEPVGRAEEIGGTGSAGGAIVENQPGTEAPTDAAGSPVPQQKVKVSFSSLKTGQYVELNLDADVAKSGDVLTATQVTIFNLKHLQDGKLDVGSLPFTRSFESGSPIPGGQLPPDIVVPR